MKEETIQREMIEYSKECPKCKKVIRGYSESQAEHNFKIHLVSIHKEGGKKK